MVQLRAKLLKMKMLQDKAGALGDSRCMCPYTSYQKTEKQTERKLSFSQAEVKGNSAGGDWKVLGNSELRAG